MSFKSRLRGAVAPLRRNFAMLGQPNRPEVDAMVAEERPEEPVFCIRPRTLSQQAQRFVQAFPGDVMYAVKCNPEPAVLRALWRGGVRHFDVASPGEIRLLAQLLPKARLHYMHPVKGRAAIRAAYAEFGVRHFAIDSAEEIDKILAETGQAGDLELTVRIAVPKAQALHDLGGKFGAEPAEAVALLRRARPLAAKLGVSFHVGSQCLEPEAFERAIAHAAGLVREAGVAIDLLDVGGGFPVAYEDAAPPAPEAFVRAIVRAFARSGLPEGVRLACEPGRVLVAAGASLVVKVERRRGDRLYLNDGVYGGLADAGPSVGLRFPVRLVRPGGAAEGARQAFAFFGPTCDSADRMEGPFLLPADVGEGDWIEIGQLGAYGACLRTAFNGFDRARIVEVADRPLEPARGLARLAA